MSKLAAEHKKDGFVVLAVNGWNEPRKQVAEFAQEHKLQQTILLDGNEVAGRYNVKWYPSLFWIDRRGEIVKFDEGGADKATLKRRAKMLIAKGG